MQRNSRQTFEIQLRTDKHNKSMYNGANKIPYAHNFQQLINVSNKRDSEMHGKLNEDDEDSGHQQSGRQQYKITNLQ